MLQIHVLAYSIHALLNGLSQHLNPGDLDPCLEDFCTIVTNDLFGTPSEERDTPEAVKKLPEAKTTKGYETLELMVSKLSPKVVPHVIESLLKVRTYGHTVVYNVLPVLYIDVMVCHIASADSQEPTNC